MRHHQHATQGSHTRSFVTMASPKLRKTRIVCISDTHNSTVKLPPGDVLIHAGDLTNQGSYSELERTVKWLESAPYEAKIVIAGNHDITLDERFYNINHQSFHNTSPQDPSSCLSLLTSSPSITYLSHNSTVMSLTSPSGPRTTFKVFGSPYSPSCGLWAFGYEAPTSPSAYSDLTAIWEDIPLDTDVVVTHTPPRTHCDESNKRRAEGCEALRRRLWRVRPRLAVCGHIHPARGAERVSWDLSSRNVAFAETNTWTWEDPSIGSNKLSLLDLTGRRGGAALDNDGSHPKHPQSPSRHTMDDTPRSPPRRYESTKSNFGGQEEAQACSSTLGLGGDPATSSRCDVEALGGRMGRKETAVVNAAIVRTNYPHTGGKKIGKPIVLDLDLPVWEE